MVVDRRPVVGGAEEVADDDRTCGAEEVRGEDRVAERLRHLLAADGDESVVQPVRGEGVPGSGRLCELVLVVREAQVQSAAVDVERGPEVAPGHRGALDVPPGASRTPRRVPAGGRGLPRLAALPEREVTGIPLAAGIGVGGVDHVVTPLPGEGAVPGPARGVEVDVPTAVRCRVGVTALDQPRDDVLHLRDARRRPGLVGRGQDAERRVRGRELELDAVRARPPGLVGAGGQVEDLVVDVGDVADERDAVPAVAEPATPDVVDQGGPEVPDVRRGLHRRTADVDADLSVDQGHEVDDVGGAGVVQANGHTTSLEGVPTGDTGRPAACGERADGVSGSGRAPSRSR